MYIFSLAFQASMRKKPVSVHYTPAGKARGEACVLVVCVRVRACKLNLQITPTQHTHTGKHAHTHTPTHVQVHTRESERLQGSAAAVAH